MQEMCSLCEFNTRLMEGNSLTSGESALVYVRNYPFRLTSSGLCASYLQVHFETKCR